MFTPDQIKMLQEPLDPANVKPRKGPNGKTVSYVEGWQVLEECNVVFGFGNWSRETVLMEALHDPVLITDPDSPEKGKVVSAFFAKVRITVWSEDGKRSIVREGCGAARGFAKTAGEAMEQAIKASETDATKRGLVSFGSRFGLALYDREQRNVGKPERRQVLAPSGSPLAPIDEGFDQSQPQRPTTSQRALAVSSRQPASTANGRDRSTLPY
jgi:recombination DNA repair RAD52 pathway protein